jgi:serine/threonine protein kinase
MLTRQDRIRSRYDAPYDRRPLYEMGVSDIGIDFISRLLNPDPAKRMTMKDALNHEWLSEAESSSLPNEPSSQGLGGDSMWNIQAFESENDIEEEDGCRAGRWSRPMTASTNFETSGTGESFSQPMEGLHLESKAGDHPLSPANEDDEGSERMEWAPNGERKDNGTAGPSPDTSLEHDANDLGGNNLGTNVTPTKANPNGNGVASVMDVDCGGPASAAPSSMDVDKGAASSELSSMDVDKGTASSVLSNNSRNKRKQTASMFSSGSLSPPPDEEQGRDTTPQPPQVEGPRRVTRAETARKVTPPSTGRKGGKEAGTPKAVGTRKSRRLG